MANINGAFGLRPIAKLGQGSNSTGFTGYTPYEIASDNSNPRDAVYNLNDRLSGKKTLIISQTRSGLAGLKLLPSAGSPEIASSTLSVFGVCGWCLRSCCLV